MKCGADHAAKDYVKKPEQTPTCCNSCEGHTANFCECPYYKHVLETATPKITPKPQTIPIKTQTNITTSNHSNFIQNTKNSYANAVKNTNTENVNKIIVTDSLALLTVLLSALTSD